MKYLYSALLALLIINTSHSQIRFKEGYYIDNNDIKYEGLIKNFDGLNNPDKFYFKKSESSETKIFEVEEVKEFGIYSIYKYKSVLVDIEQSSNRASQLSTSSKLRYIKDKVFLKEVFSGQYNLYEYVKGPLKRFYFSKGEGEITPLVHKLYKNNKNQILENNTFRYQILQAFDCEDIDMSKLQTLRYRKESLVKIFSVFHECVDTEYQILRNDIDKKDKFNLNVKFGINLARFLVTYPHRTYTFNKTLFPRVGFETEFILPFNNNKWSILFEPIYKRYRASEEDKPEANVNYQSIEASLGIRHYFYIDKENSVFVNVLFINDLDLGSSVAFSENSNGLELQSSYGISAGGGFNFRNRLSIEARYGFDRDLFVKYIHVNSSYTNVALTLGYTIL